jgi:hypothetical protein
MAVAQGKTNQVLDVRVAIIVERRIVLSAIEVDLPSAKEIVMLFPFLALEARQPPAREML